MTCQRYFTRLAYLPHGWAEDVLLEVDGQGYLQSVKPNQSATGDLQILDGPVIPGMPNVHSHAFQRAMAG